jgi:hypothetical protein
MILILHDIIIFLGLEMTALNNSFKPICPFPQPMMTQKPTTKQVITQNRTTQQMMTQKLTAQPVMTQTATTQKLTVQPTLDSLTSLFCKNKDMVQCPSADEPVCASDGNTYQNK